MSRTHRSILLGSALAAIMAGATQAQVVSVTVSLEKTQIAVGETTTLHVYAQIVPALRPTSDRIFSWYVDLLNSSGSTSQFDAGALVKPSSDKDLRTSSPGTAEGSNQRGIFDTFINLAGAGRDAPVELFSVPVRGMSPGSSTLGVTAGTGVTGLAADFIVAPLGGGDPLLGGGYSGASTALQVAGVVQGPVLGIGVALLPDGQSRRATLTFAAIPGRNHFVEFRDSLTSGAWQPLPGSPHNSGTATDTSTTASRFYRLRLAN